MLHVWRLRPISDRLSISGLSAKRVSGNLLTFRVISLGLAEVAAIRCVQQQRVTECPMCKGPWKGKRVRDCENTRLFHAPRFYARISGGPGKKLREVVRAPDKQSLDGLP